MYRWVGRAIYMYVTHKEILYYKLIHNIIEKYCISDRVVRRYMYIMVESKYTQITLI